jgi:hypothetical protein
MRDYFLRAAHMLVNTDDGAAPHAGPSLTG